MVTNIMEKKEVKLQRQSESITFRLDSTILNKLHSEADQKDISVNTLVSHIIRRHIDWHSNTPKAGFIAVRRLFITNFMSYLSEQEIVSTF
jgi:CopG antitoxin of type II toxin-antitoxin system